MSTNGLSRQIHEMAENFKRLGWSVTTASAVCFRPLRFVHILWVIGAARASYRTALVTVFSGNAFIWADASVWLLRRLNKRVICILSGGNLPEFAKRHPSRVTRFLKGADEVIAPSLFLKQAMQPYARRPISVIPNGVSFSPVMDSRAKPLRPDLIWVRAFHQLYNPLLAVEILRRTLQRYPEAHLTMIGPDKGDGTFQAVRQAACDPDLKDRLTIIPGIAHEEVPGVLAGASIFLNTTSADNAPVSVIEGMAYGLCIISTNVGGIPYLLTDRENALLVPANNPEVMTKAVAELLEDPELARRLSERARQDAMQYDWSVVMEAWEKMLENHPEKSGNVCE